MSAESKRVQINVLEPKELSRFEKPEFRYLTVSDPMELEKAFKVAREYIRMLPIMGGSCL